MADLIWILGIYSLGAAVGTGLLQAVVALLRAARRRRPCLVGVQVGGIPRAPRRAPMAVRKAVQP